MKHAGTSTLEKLEPCLNDLRRIDGLAEKRPGVFYRGSRAFLHFHEDPAGVFADVRLSGDDFDRRDVSSRHAQRELVRAIRAVLAEPVTRPR